MHLRVGRTSVGDVFTRKCKINGDHMTMNTILVKLLGSHMRKGMDSQHIRLTGQIPHVATAQQ